MIKALAVLLCIALGAGHTTGGGGGDDLVCRGVKEMLEKCCPDYVEILEDRTYGQVYKPLTGTYCPACGPDKPCPTGQTCTSSGLGRKLRFGFSGGDGCCILDTS